MTGSRCFQTTSSGVRLRALASLLLVGVVGCAGTPEVPLPVELPVAFSATGDGQRVDRWWHDLRDPVLSEFVEEALRSNPDLQSVWDRLAQARAIARREGAGLGPALDFDPSARTTWSDQSDLRTNLSGGNGLVRRENFRLGLTLSWEIDVFGRLRAARDAARFDALASEEELRAAAIVLSAQVADQWYEVALQTGQLALLDQQIETNSAVERLVAMRFRAGQAGAADVLRQRQLVEQRRGERLQVAAQAQTASHALAVLLGRSPVAAEFARAQRLPTPGPLPELGLPVELLDRRPDVKRAYLDVLAADRRLHVARADRYPRLSLSASPAYSAQALSDLMDNWAAELAASLVAPLFDSGRRRAEVDRTRAVVSERIHGYGQVVLTSLQEVEDALVQERQQHSLIASLESQLELARQTLERLRDRYVKGATDYLDVLDALSSQQVLERSVLTARRDLLGFRIDLHRALAGGFDLDASEPLAVDRASRDGIAPVAESSSTLREEVL